MDIDPQDILTWNLEKLWASALVILDEETLSDLEREQLNIAKNGITIEVPIQYLTKKYYEEYPSSKKAKILGFGKLALTKLWEEIEKRENLLKKLIIDNMDEDNPLKAR